jgi:hypothetical protein
MYKFEISAPTYDELRDKIVAYANEVINSEPTNQMEMDIPPAPVVPIAERSQFDDPGFIPDFQREYKEQYLEEKKQEAQVTGIGALESPPVITALVAPTLVEKVTKWASTLDSKGMQWDSRIHAATKAVTKDGAWRYKRGVDDATITQIEAEYKSNPVPSTFSGVVPPPPPPTIAVELPKFVDQPKTHSTNAAGEVTFAPLTNVVNPAAVPSAPVKTYEQVQVPGGTRPAHSLITFKNNLMDVFAQLITEDKINQAYITELKNYFQVKEIWNVLGNEAQCIELYNEFGARGFITKVD